MNDNDYLLARIEDLENRLTEYDSKVAKIVQFANLTPKGKLMVKMAGL